MDSDSNAQIYRFLIAQTQKIGILQVTVSKEDTCDQNGKPSIPLSIIITFIPYQHHQKTWQTHVHYFSPHTPFSLAVFASQF